MKRRETVGETKRVRLARRAGPRALSSPPRRELGRDLFARLEHLERATRSGHFVYEPATGRLKVTQGLLALFAPEPPPDDVTLDWIYAHFSATQARRLRVALAHGQSSAKPFKVGTAFALTDGTQRCVELDLAPELDRNGQVTALHGVARDTSDLIQLQQDRKRIEERHRLVFDQSADVISHVDREGRFVFVSPAGEQLTGFKPSEMVGRTVTDFTHPEDFPLLAENTRRWKTDRTPRTLQYRTLTKSGSYLWIESTIRPLVDPLTDRVLGALSISRDIRARRRTEEELRLAQARSETSNRAKSRFLANMSHELRTPLNAIIGFSEILSSEMFGPIGSERYKEYASLILVSGRHLLDLINDLLDMSKIEAGRHVLSPDMLDIEELLGSAMRLVHRQVEAKGLSIKIVAATLSSPLIADQRAIKQIVLNLLSNAIKFTPAGGEIRLSASESEAYVTIAVSDTGIGIPQSALGRLARPFEQVHDNLHITQGGTGLGLALVRSLARLHGGEIEIESCEGEGTTVHVHVPHQPIKRPAARLPKSA
jgi:PAS domain S-box-containing protein